jgi:uncharacterized protein YukE
MNTEDLKKQLANETQAKNQSIELAKTALMNSATSFQKDLSESAQNFRSDLRDETKKAREAWERTTEQERQSWAEERKQWETAKRKVLLWGPLALLVVVLITASLSVALTWIAVSKGTGMALTGLQQGEASKLADLRAQTETASAVLEKMHADVQTSRKTLADLQQSIEEQNKLLMQAKERSSRITNYSGQNGEIYVETWPGAQPITFQGKMLIQVKPNSN